MDEEQREYYTALEQQQRIKVNKYLQSNTPSKVYQLILVLLLRLRQECFHPWLTKDDGILEEAQLNRKEMESLARQLDK